MPRFGTANGNAHITHAVDRTGYAGFLKDNIFRRFGLFFFNVFFGNDRFLL